MVSLPVLVSMFNCSVDEKGYIYKWALACVSFLPPHPTKPFRKGQTKLVNRTNTASADIQVSVGGCEVSFVWDGRGLVS